MADASISNAVPHRLDGAKAAAILNRLVLWAAFLTLSAICVYPMIWLFLNAFKSISDRRLKGYLDSLPKAGEPIRTR